MIDENTVVFAIQDDAGNWKIDKMDLMSRLEDSCAIIRDIIQDGGVIIDTPHAVMVKFSEILWIPGEAGRLSSATFPGAMYRTLGGMAQRIGNAIAEAAEMEKSLMDTKAIITALQKSFK